MIISILLTKYILMPIYYRFLIFLTVSFFIREFYLFEGLALANCMQTNTDFNDEEILSFVKNWKQDALRTQYGLNTHKAYGSCRGKINECPGLDLENMSALSQNNFDILTNFIEKNYAQRTILQQQNAQLANKEIEALAYKAQSELVLRERIQFHETEKRGLYKIINSMHEKNHLRIKQTIAEFLEPQQLVNENSSNPIELHLSSESKAENLPLSLRFEKGSNPTINIINNTVADTPKNEDKNTSWFSWCNIS